MFSLLIFTHCRSYNEPQLCLVWSTSVESSGEIARHWNRKSLVISRRSLQCAWNSQNTSKTSFTQDHKPRRTPREILLTSTAWWLSQQAGAHSACNGAVLKRQISSNNRILNKHTCCHYGIQEVPWFAVCYLKNQESWWCHLIQVWRLENWESW